MIICDMCKKEIKGNSPIKIHFYWDYQKKLNKSGFNDAPEFCCIGCAIQYLSECALLFKEPILIHSDEGTKE